MGARFDGWWSRVTGNVLIINFAGLGDGLIELPFLKNMEGSAPQMRFFHNGGTMFDDEELMRVLDFRVCGGIVPAIWRKFAAEHWVDIEAFVQEQGIRRIINLRNLGPEFDTGYFAFKQRLGTNIEFFDYPSGRAYERNIRDDIDKLLRCAGLVDGDVDLQILRKQVRSTQPRELPRGVGINIHAGTPFKWWPYAKWKELCLGLIDFELLRVFAGHGEQEGQLASQLVGELESHRCGRAQLVGGYGTLGVLREIAALKCVVSADSWITHAASGIGTRSVALHIVTSSRTWGAAAGLNTALESRYLRACSRFSAPLGACLDQYAGCAMVKQFGDGIEVKDALSLVLDSINQ